MEGDRQWLRLNFDNEFSSSGFLDWLYATRTKLAESCDQDSQWTNRPTLLISRFRRDFMKKERVPVRLWKMDRSGVLQRYSGCVEEGAVVICSFTEMRAYKKKEVDVVAELHRDIVVVRKSNKRRRVVQYFSDDE
jgi:hypothetical protein